MRFVHPFAPIAGLLAACAAPPAPEPLEVGFAPAFSGMDSNGDGSLSETEFRRVSYALPDFAALDTDHDGALALGEFTRMIATTDPVYFDKRQDFDAQQTKHAPHPVPGTELSYRLSRDYFRFQAEELRARGVPAPGDAEIAEAAEERDLAGPRSLLLEAKLRAAASR
jgi:hypothetical protein